MCFINCAVLTEMVKPSEFVYNFDIQLESTPSQYHEWDFVSF